MATTANLKPYSRDNFSGGEQNKTTKFQKEPGEVSKAINAQFGRIGGVEKVMGFEKIGHSITETSSSSTSSSSSSSSSSTSTSTSTSTSSSTSSSTSTSSTTTP